MLFRVGMAIAKSNDGPDSKLELIIQFCKENKYNDALERVLITISEEPENPQLWYIKGVICANLNNKEDAILSFKEVDQLYPNHGPTLSNLAVLLEDSSVNEAKNYATMASVAYPDIESNIRIRTQKNTNEILESNQGPLLISVPVDNDIYPSFEENEDNAENDEDLMSLLNDSQNEISQEEKALNHMNNGEYLEAVKIWKKMLDTNPEIISVWNGLGEALIKAGYDEKGQQCKARAMKLDELQSKKNGKEKDEINYYVTENLDHSNPESNNEISDIKSDVQDNDYLDRVNASIEWFNRGTSFLSEGNSEEALSCFEKSIGGCPKDELELRVRSQNGRGDSLYNMGKYSDSILAYHAAISLEPNLLTGRTLYNMGQSYAYLELYEDGLKCFEQAISRGLEAEGISLCKTQINRCKILLKEQRKNTPN